MHFNVVSYKSLFFVGGGGSGGPMRRGRDGPMRRNTPYGGGRSDFGGGSRFGRSDSGPIPQMPAPPAFGGGFDDNFGFSNQDRRGFALPNQYDTPQRGGFQRSAGPSSGGGGGGGFRGPRNDSGRQGGLFFNKFSKKKTNIKDANFPSI